MDEELARLVDSYSSGKRFADKQFIDSACYDLVSYYDLHDYLKHVNAIRSFSKYTDGSSYFPRMKIMSIELCKSRKYIRQLSKDYPDDYHFWYNLFVLKCILHEMDHVKQEKTRESKIDTIESSLIYLNNILDESINTGFLSKLLSSVKVNRYGSYYAKNHDLSPIERLANINAYKELIDIINIMDKDDLEAVVDFKCSTIKDFLEQIRFGYRLDGDMTNSPSLDYLCGMKSTNNKELISKLRILKVDGIDIKDKLKYGFALKKDEFEIVNDDVKTLKLFNIR